MSELHIRRLRAGDERIVEELATRAPRTALLADERTIFLVAFEGEQPVGFVLAYELLRRHGGEKMLLIYEIEVEEAFRRQGIGTNLLRRLEEIGRSRGNVESFVLTDAENEAANALYGSLGGQRSAVVEWDFELGVG